MLERNGVHVAEYKISFLLVNIMYGPIVQCLFKLLIPGMGIFVQSDKL